ncbi:hypothetical protein Patl1_15100 [Pistacia atlantica]|uniref:Uncharacterized protein n=1 Tax=Pistacia atlantica TaxID=434234 RepID=A0ACC1B5Q0_9ROSI|nr:hypothetical protein Patl1_15100 [Pistacia atlantica]
MKIALIYMSPMTVSLSQVLGFKLLVQSKLCHQKWIVSRIFLRPFMNASGSGTSTGSVGIGVKLETSCEPDKAKTSETSSRKPEDMVLQMCLHSDVIDVSEERKKEQNNRPKRTRSAEIHNMSERRRRDRINKSLRTLQELVPNCNKSDRASVLDDAVNYLKALKSQIMSAARGAILQASFMSPSGVQSAQVSQLSQFVPMRQELRMANGFGMGVAAGMCYSPGVSMVSVPSAGLHPSLPASSCRLPSGVSARKPYASSSSSAAYSFRNVATVCRNIAQAAESVLQGFLLHSTSQAGESIVLRQCVALPLMTNNFR